MILLRAIVSTIAPGRARMLLATLAVWWHALAALATSYSESALATACEAYDAADEHGDATTCAAFVAAFTGVDASTLYSMARAPREASEARNMARDALPMIDALLAELDAGSSCATAPSVRHVEGVREAFARALLEYAAEVDAPALALVGAEVMFQNYGNGDCADARTAVTAVCETIAKELDAGARAQHGSDEARIRMENAALAMRDGARILVAGSHLLDAIVAQHDGGSR